MPASESNKEKDSLLKDLNFDILDEGLTVTTMSDFAQSLWIFTFIFTGSLPRKLKISS